MLNATQRSDKHLVNMICSPLTFLAKLTTAAPALGLMLAALWLASCTPQEPIQIIITPTPQSSATPAITAIPTLAPSATPTLVPSTLTPQAASMTPSEVVQTRFATATPLPATPTVVGDGSFFGSIVNEDYVVPPSPTPRPTATPIPSVTPTPRNTPVVTALPDAPRLDNNAIGLQLYYNMDVAGWDNVLRYTQAAGVGWIKLQANWSWLQPNGPNQFDQSFRLFQLHVQEADKRGLRVLISIAKAPPWARNVNRNEDGPPDNPQDLANFIRFMLDKIGPNIDAIEVWNEPNLIREWTGALPFNGGGYMQLFRPAYDAIRAYSPSMFIITAGLAPVGNVPGAVDDRTFMQQMYDAGLANYRDIAIGIHPYGWGNPPDSRCCNPIPDRGWDDDPHFFFLDNIEDYRRIMVRNGHGDLQMWSTEFGWATWDFLWTEPPDPWMTYNTPELQAQYTLRAFEIGEERDYLGPMFLWNLNFANQTVVSERNEIAGYSLLINAPDGSTWERPLYQALVNR